MAELTKNDIWKRRKDLERELRAKLHDVADEHRRVHADEVAQLRAACEALGHEWRFSHLGPTGVAWSYCSVCSASKTE